LRGSFATEKVRFVRAAGPRDHGSRASPNPRQFSVRGTISLPRTLFDRLNRAAVHRIRFKGPAE
jgi:hypothetical protein